MPHEINGVLAGARTDLKHLVCMRKGHLQHGQYRLAIALAGALVVYGPFNHGGRYTSDSNAAFDADLRSRGVGSGLRDFEAVNEQAAGVGLKLQSDTAMPANNRTLVWRKE